LAAVVVIVFTVVSCRDAARLLGTVRARNPRGACAMRFIVPLILIALMLPYATGDDSPSGEWLIQPDPQMAIDAAAADAAEAAALRACAAGIDAPVAASATPLSPSSPRRAAHRVPSTQPSAVTTDGDDVGRCASRCRH
jgi:hypothetical protein